MSRVSRLSDRDDWFQIWFSDKQSMLEIMVTNMASDLANGYSYFGSSIRAQRDNIDNYKRVFDAQMDEFKTMPEPAINKWCFYDLLKRGVIE